MIGKRYDYAMMQLDIQGVIHPDAHIFSQEVLYQDKPDVVEKIITQLSLKAGLKEWVDKAYSAAKSKMKQLQFRNKFIFIHWSDLNYKGLQIVLDSQMLIKENRDRKIKG